MTRMIEAGRWPTPDDKACFAYHIGKGTGPCCAAITPEEYAPLVARVERFLAGERDEFVGELEAEMKEAAAELDFEHAARARDRLEAIKALQEKQKAVLSRPLNIDVIGFFREETIAAAHVSSYATAESSSATISSSTRASTCPRQTSWASSFPSIMIRRPSFRMRSLSPNICPKR